MVLLYLNVWLSMYHDVIWLHFSALESRGRFASPFLTEPSQCITISHDAMRHPAEAWLQYRQIRYVGNCLTTSIKLSLTSHTLVDLVAACPMPCQGSGYMSSNSSTVGIFTVCVVACLAMRLALQVAVCGLKYRNLSLKSIHLVEHKFVAMIAKSTNMFATIWNQFRITCSWWQCRFSLLFWQYHSLPPPCLKPTRADKARQICVADTLAKRCVTQDTSPASFSAQR